ncbi:uncharacterized protein G2W53_030570 [Senna tora]|uniref:Uncharacterized protein n=1 Tax=Senna tora TaxID=362788 RepID=A0A834T9C4_9FABA|nr:uncharacterized protein G2W53_030570 [Senna tora]
MTGKPGNSIKAESIQNGRRFKQSHKHIENQISISFSSANTNTTFNHYSLLIVNGEETTRFHSRPLWSSPHARLPPLSSLPYRYPSNQNRNRRQRPQSPILGPSNDGGRVEEWRSGGAISEEQHNGVNTTGVDGDYAELTDRGIDDEWRRRDQNDGRSVWEQKRAVSFREVLRDIGVLLAGVSIQCSIDKMLTSDYVASAVNRGSYFWSLGLRAFYFSFPLFLWIFGPIPMFVSCVVLVFMLYFLDVTFECGWAAVSDNTDVEAAAARSS